MKHIKELIVSIIIYGAILFIVYNFIPKLGFNIVASKYNIIFTFGILWAIFWFLNTIVKKILKIITLPLKILTLGLSSLLINIIIFYAFEFLVNYFQMGIVIGLGTIIQVIILALIITLTYFLIKKII